jgi:hypothetical protein
VLGFIACGAVVRRDAYLAAGGFHPRLGTGAEEKLLAVDLARRGWGLAYVEDVVAHHHPSERRDDGRRRAVVTRNDLWFTWLRRPARSAGRRTLALLGEAAGDAAGRRGVVEALAGLRWVLREREVVPPELELAARLVEL